MSINHVASRSLDALVLVEGWGSGELDACKSDSPQLGRGTSLVRYVGVVNELLC